MAKKTIRIPEDVYERLEARKRDGETFTELLERLLDRLVDREKGVNAGFGAWVDTDKSSYMRDAHEQLNEGAEDAVSEFRKRTDDDR